MQFDKGYLSPSFVTDAERGEAVLENSLVLLYQGKISTIAEIMPVLEKIVQAKKPLTIIAEDVDGEALSALVVNKLRGTINVVALKAPGFGDRRKAIMQDLAILTGGTVVTGELGIDLPQVTLEHLGSARRVTVTKSHTTIVDGGGDPEAIEDRVQQLRRELSAWIPNGTARSSRSAWPSLPAAWASSRLVPQLRLRRRNASTASRTLCPPPVPLWKRASSPAAVPHWSTH